MPKEKAGILVDEQFGGAILRDAAAKGLHTACPAEKSGQEEFDFEYGEDFAAHIEAFHPTFWKVLVRYNPEGDPELNRGQAARLRRLSDYLHAANRSLFMFELLVPAEKAQLEKSRATRRPTISRFARAYGRGDPGIAGCGMSSRTSGRSKGSIAAKIARRSSRPRSAGGRNTVGCIILGRGEDDQQVREWLTTAAGVRVHRLRGRPDRFLAAACRLARQQNFARESSG